MPTMNISLPETLKAFVDIQVVEGAYASVSDYIRALIREDQRRQEAARREQALLTALDQGTLGDMTPESWAGLRGRLSGKVGD